MTNNHILKQIASGLGLNADELLAVFRHIDPEVAPEDVRDILKNEGDKDFVLLSDDGLALFLDGLIYHRRGGEKRKPEAGAELDNNTVLKKLRIALDMKEEVMLERFKAAGCELKASELTAFFRKKGHRNYRSCGDKVLGAFLKAL